MAEQTPNAVGGAEKPKEAFTIDKALDTKGFPEFLAAHPETESFDMSDAQELQKQFEAFEAREVLKKDLKELYGKQIKEEMGINLEKGDLDALDEYLNEQAFENPEELMVLQEKLRAFQALPGRIAAAEQKLNELGTRADAWIDESTLLSRKEDLEEAKGYTGRWGRTKLHAKTAWNFVYGVSLDEARAHERTREASSFVKERYGNIGEKQRLEILANTERDIVAIKEKIGKIEAAKLYKEQASALFLQARREVLGQMGGIPELSKAVQERAFKQFDELGKTGKLSDLEKAQRRLEELRAVSGGTETGVNIFEDADDAEFQERLDAAIEAAASKEIEKALTKVSLGAGAFSKLERALEPFVTREKLGSKEGQDARELILDMLERVADGLPQTTDGKTKRVMLARVWAKIKNS